MQEFRSYFPSVSRKSLLIFNVKVWSDDSFDHDARRRGGVCPPENTEHTHSLGQAAPAPTAN